MRNKATYYAIAPVFAKDEPGYCLLRFRRISDLRRFIERDGNHRSRVSWVDVRIMFPQLNRGSGAGVWVDYPSKSTNAQYLAVDSITKTPQVWNKRS